MRGTRAPFVVVVVAIFGTALAVAPWLHDRYRAPKLLVLSLAGAAAAWSVSRRWRPRPVDAALAAYFALGLLSAAWNDRVWTLGASWFAVEAAGALLLIAASEAQVSERRQDALQACIVAAASLVAAVTLLESLGIFSWPAAARPGATLGNRNFVAAYVAIALPVALARVLWSPSAGRCGQLLVLAIALLLTHARGAWLSVLVALAIATAAGAWLLGRVRARPRMRGLLAAGGSLALAALLIAAVPWRGLAWRESGWSSAQRLFAVEEGTGRLRAQELRVGLAIALAHPILGAGPRQWHDALDEHAHAARDHHVEGGYGSPVPQSTYARVAAEQGWLGLIAFMLVIALLARDAWRRLSAPDAPVARLAGALTALVVACVHGVFEAPLANAETLVVIAVLAGTLRPSSDERPWTRAALAGRVGLVAAGCACALIGAMRFATAVPAHASPDDLRAELRWFPMPEVAEDLGTWLAEERTCEEAEPVLEQAARWSPHHTTVLYHLALCASLHDRDQARALFQRILAIEPHDQAKVERLAAANGVDL